MASYTTAQISDDLDFANNDFQVTLTTVSPSSSSGVTFTGITGSLAGTVMPWKSMGVKLW